MKTEQKSDIFLAHNFQYCSFREYTFCLSFLLGAWQHLSLFAGLVFCIAAFCLWYDRSILGLQPFFNITEFLVMSYLLQRWLTISSRKWFQLFFTLEDAPSFVWNESNCMHWVYPGLWWLTITILPEVWQKAWQYLLNCAKLKSTSCSDALILCSLLLIRFT